ncbi:MAG: hypothetical protein ACXADH_01050 [Candidatus Kariarchaeaceae archaeon]
MKKWIMKQYWRVGQIRALTGLAMGMLVIGKLYLSYVPVLNEMGLIGALVLGMSLFLLFLGLGWIYDVKLKMWSQKNQAIIERNAYYHIALISSKAYDYPILYALLSSFRGVMKKTGVDTSSLNPLVKHLQEYYNLKPNKVDIDRTLVMGKQFFDDHPFTSSKERTDESIPLTSKIKLAWEVQILRLTWVQSLTGLVQDTLVFGILYVFVIFPDTPAQNALFLGIFGISIPVLIVLLILGWIYDRKLTVWSADLTVKIERNPYSYVAEPSLYAFTIPFYYTLFKVLHELLLKYSLETERVEKIIEYLDEYSTLVSSRSQDLNTAVQLRKSLGRLFMEEKQTWD